MNPVTCAQWYRPFRIERTAMMRRNSTRRRVHTFSSGSIRSDDIAAIDIASLPLSPPDRAPTHQTWQLTSESGLNAGWNGLMAPNALIALSWPAGTAKSIAHEADQGAVTGQSQGARIGTNQN